MNGSGRNRSWAAVGLVGLLSACGGGTPTPATDAGPSGTDAPAADARASTRGTVSGTVTYTGTGTGRLTVGVWAMTPPMGPPIDFFGLDAPTFPLDYGITGLAAGTYFVGAVLDIGADNPTLPGAEDPRSFPTSAIVIVGGDTHDVDIVLTDPAPAP